MKEKVPHLKILAFTQYIIFKQKKNTFSGLFLLLYSHRNWLKIVWTQKTTFLSLN